MGRENALRLADRGRGERVGRRTAAIARAVAARDPRVSVIELATPGPRRGAAGGVAGVGRAVVAYMDVDLSTNLDALADLVAPVLSGEADVAIGTRLAPAARVRRRLRREVLSRSYNALARATVRRAVQRRAVRLQGAARRRRARAPPAGGRRRMVLRHRAPAARPARRLPDRRGAGRVGRGPRLARAHRADGHRRPARALAPARATTTPSRQSTPPASASAGCCSPSMTQPMSTAIGGTR